MIIDGFQVVACPSCQALAKFRTLLSGNTVGMRMWTDGKQYARWLPEPPGVVQCGGCHTAYWLSDAKTVGIIKIDQSFRRRLLSAEGGDEQADDVHYVVSPTGLRQSAPAEWLDAAFVEEPSEREYYEAIRTGLARIRERERILRVLAWWRGNDAWRDLSAPVTPTQQPTSPEREDNLRALLPLLGQSDEGDLLMRAEVFRELRMWREAEEILSGEWSEDFSFVAALIRSLSEARDALVREVTFPERFAFHCPDCGVGSRSAVSECKECGWLKYPALDRQKWGKAGSCPHCGASYRWDGDRCSHCGHGKADQL